MIRVRDDKDQVNVAKVYRADQEHIFRFWEDLSFEERSALLAQIEGIDFQLLKSLLSKQPAPPAPPVYSPPEVVRLPRTPEEEAARAEAAVAGEEALREGRVCAFTAAGGQGTRLGFDGPKGMYPIGPVSGHSLFQIFADGILAAGRKYRTTIPWYIMVSSTNEAETKAFFQESDYFGLSRADVHFLRQKEMPAVDPRGKLLLSEKGRIAMSPNGHGGTLELLQESGALDEMKRRGITTISYFQVDNPLVKPIDPVFIGFHLLQDAEMSVKGVRKRRPEEKVGVICRTDGHVGVVEYSELTDEQTHERDENGELRFGMGNTAIHLLDVDFVADLDEPLPYHRAHKKVPHVDRKGGHVSPGKPNAYKFERFIFDALPVANNPVVLEIDRELEFAPVKSKDGPTSPEAVRRKMTECYSRWLEEQGIDVPRSDDGKSLLTIEISPLYAASRSELSDKLEGVVSDDDGEVLLR